MSTVRFGILASIWTAAALGILQLRNVQFEHAFCLPSRCGPPLGALLSIQLFWLLGVVTIAGGMLYFRPQGPWRRIGLFVTLAAAMGMAVVIGIDYVRFPPSAHPHGSPGLAAVGHQLHRFIFPVVTMTDVPWLQTALGGMLLWFGGSRSRSQEHLQPPLEEVVAVDGPAQGLH